MSDTTEPGATGRRRPGGAAVQSDAAAPAAPLAEGGEAKPIVVGVAPVPMEVGGPGAGALQAASETDAVETRPLERLDADHLDTRQRAELSMLQRDTGVVADARAVPGYRLARAVTTIKRYGQFYGPGTGKQWVTVDFEAYTELVSIGAITDTPWSELEPIGES